MKILGIGLGILAIIVVMFLLGWGTKIIDMKVERSVLVNSHQYIEGQNSERKILQAALAEINSRLHSLTPKQEYMRNGLLAQRATIKVQLNAN